MFFSKEKCPNCGSKGPFTKTEGETGFLYVLKTSVKGKMDPGRNTESYQCENCFYFLERCRYCHRNLVSCSSAFGMCEKCAEKGKMPDLTGW